MKMKKIVLLLSMLVLNFSLSACSDGQENVDFDYSNIEIINSSVVLTYNILGLDEATKIIINNTEGQEVYQSAISNFESVNEECGEFLGFRTKEGGVVSLNDIAGAESDEVYNQYLLGIESDISEEGEAVKAEFTAVYEDRDVEINFLYVSAPTQATSDEQTGEVIVPFQISEVTVSPVYTNSEIATQAGMNTLMGMGTVFVVLILIAVIIGQFERLAKAIIAVSSVIGGKVAKFKEKRAAKKAAKLEVLDNDKDTGAGRTAVPVTAASNTDNVINDTELAAVITAAIMASEGLAGSAGSDGLIVRSIKKAKR